MIINSRLFTKYNQNVRALKLLFSSYTDIGMGEQKLILAVNSMTSMCINHTHKNETFIQK